MSDITYTQCTKCNGNGSIFSGSFYHSNSIFDGQPMLIVCPLCKGSGVIIDRSDNKHIDRVEINTE